MPRNLEHVQLDFDETLFNHHAFAHWADGQLTTALDIEPGSYKGSFDKHHTHLENGLRLYDNRQHIEEVTNRTWSFISGLIERLWHEDGEPDFCYPDVAEALTGMLEDKLPLSILTFGNEGYQRFKIGFCPILRGTGIGVHVVDEPKRDYIAREFKPSEHGALVDDKPDLKLPKNWVHIWVNRQEPVCEPKQIEEGVWHVSDLTQAQRVLTEMA